MHKDCEGMIGHDQTICPACVTSAPRPVEHELKYAVGASGLAHLGIPNNSQPHWYCTCGRWRKDRNLRGQPFRETAEKHHRKHVREATS